jgi:hypothetical protein
MTCSPQTRPDFVTVACTVRIDRPSNKAWAEIGTFGTAGRFLNVPCEQVSGDGAIGSVREIGGAILEVMTGRSSTSYSYAQIKGPMARFAYHGCLSLEADGHNACTLVYTIVYDQSSMDEPQRTSEKQRLHDRFQGAADAMKRVAEAND